MLIMKTTLGKVVNEKRLKLGLKLREVGERCNLTPGYLSRLENDKPDGRPGKETIHSLAKALELDETRLTVLAGSIPSSIEKEIKSYLLEKRNGEQELQVFLNRRKK